MQGCDASILLDSTPGNRAEKDADLNKALHSFEVIDAAKAAIEAACPGVVSCSDILAFAARESAALSGNIFYEVPAGRRDGIVSLATEVELNLPAASFNAAQLIERFAAKKLTPDELVTLSGAHSLGVAHCSAFTHRFYNFSAASDTDPALSPAYAALIRNTCALNGKGTANTEVWLDLLTPKTLDNSYYSGLRLGFGLLGSDQALMGDPDLSAAVEDNAKFAKKWAGKFGKAMVRMGSILELTANEGEIRANCRVVNAPRPRPELALPANAIPAASSRR